MAWGILANAASTALAATAYGAAAVAAQARQRALGVGRSSGPLLFATIAAYLALAALRQVAAFLSGSDPDYEAVDRGLYLAVIVPAALVIVPHVHLVGSVWWGDRRRATAVAGAFLAVVLVGLLFAYLDGIEGPVRSDYGTDWTLRSPVTKALLVLAIMLPGIAGSAALVLLSRRLLRGDRRRVRLIGWSCLAYFAVFTLDAFGLAGLPLLLARLATAGTGLLAWSAYSSRRVDYTPPPFKPGESPYQR